RVEQHLIVGDEQPAAVYQTEGEVRLAGAGRPAQQDAAAVDGDAGGMDAEGGGGDHGAALRERAAGAVVHSSKGIRPSLRAERRSIPVLRGRRDWVASSLCS